MSVAETMRRIGRDASVRIHAWCERTGINYMTALLLLEFGETDEGRRFAAGGALRPMPTPSHVRGWARSDELVPRRGRRRYDYDYDEYEDDWGIR